LWDYGIQKYKDAQNPFHEDGLISVLFLACGRPDVTRRCLLSTLDSTKQYDGELEWIFIENGNCDENYALFQELDLERKVVVRQDNYGINEGLNQAWALSRGEFCLIHENDWECRIPTDFLSIIRDIFNERNEVGIIQLRAANDPCENFGLGKPAYNPWSCSPEVLEQAKIKVWKETTEKGFVYFISEFPNGFNNNPLVMRKSVYNSCGPYPEAEVGCDPRHGETVYQARVAELGCAIAHIGLSLYWHTGRVQTKTI
jgi:glycosyltransferase involved in cell wall biosynthesis